MLYILCIFKIKHTLKLYHFIYFFATTWEQHKFEEIFNERREKTSFENEDILLSCAINGIFLNSELFDHFRGSSTIGYLKVKKNDLILSAQNLHLGNANVNLRFEHGIISPAYKVYDYIDCNPNFIQSWVKKDETKNFFLSATTEGASQCRKNIEWNTLNKQKLLIPKFKEQKKIGEFFKQLDNDITLHQRKLEKLGNIKKSMLEKMFPKDENKVPEIRFKGFNDDWEQYKLGEISNKVTTKNSSLKYLETFTNSAEYGIISQKDFFENNISKVEKLDRYYVVEPEDFVYNPRISINAPVGPINRNTLDRCGVMSPLYSVFKTHNIDNTYLEYFFKSNYWHSFMFFNGDSGARSDRFSIKDTVFMEMPIPYPNIYEQSKIGVFLKQLDNDITLHQ